MNLRRGDVVLCRVPMPSSELADFRLRPAAVVSKDDNNRRLADVMAAPCTSNLARQQEPTQYLISGAEVGLAGIRIPSVVKCETLFTLPKSMRLGALSFTGLRAVDNCLRNALAL